ncbi:transposase [Desulfosporosinus lacus]|uniref:DDE superfamily endonuclease n=1 Tax=Desulfosporosinus lacus DSM 15449 TaxID=1121420 RepID=A0A1M5QHC4_9FIRM|nr:transposase [Desulfosporosinus lacus]SHH13318.1 DDE superfamily endonuclease [Desulfosporosinus lacus DSM 15449]
MLKLIDTILQRFQCCFKRKETYSWFVVIVVGMLVRTNLRGVSSIVGCLHLDSCHYESMIYFFRSSAFKLSDIKHLWLCVVQQHIKPVKIDGRSIVIGDHIKVGKEARYMPGVKKMHQDSENVGKEEYIFGHQFGMIGLLAEGSTTQCVPLNIGLHDGIDEVNSLKDDSTEQISSETTKETCIVKMIQMAGSYVNATSEKIIFLLDAYFPSAASFNEVEAINQKHSSKLITLIMRAKSNTVAFEEEPPKTEKRGKGRPRIYGEKIVFKNVFKNCLEKFTTIDINLYGKNETVQYLCLDLIWKPVRRKVRFVLVKTGERMMILMCSDLTQDPGKIILAYSYRFKIEVSFKMLKHIIGSFGYHFWTKALPKLSRFKTKTDLSAIKKLNDKERILATTRAIEVFTFLSCIAMGILTIISLTYPTLVWQKFSGWLRTRSSQLPSVETVRSVVQQELSWNFRNLSYYATLSKIQAYQQLESDTSEKMGT